MPAKIVSERAVISTVNVGIGGGLIIPTSRPKYVMDGAAVL
jgi:hypothetical protein